MPFFCYNPPTPFRSAEDIDGAIELLQRTGADSVISYATSARDTLPG